jgi:hypothetical protein
VAEGAAATGDTALSDLRISLAYESEKSGAAGLRPLPPHSKGRSVFSICYQSQIPFWQGTLLNN